jgi:hypothetical protein
MECKAKGLSVLEVVPSLDLRGGGLPRAVISLADSIGMIEDAKVVLLSYAHNSKPIIDIEKMHFTEFGRPSLSSMGCNFFGAQKI